MVPCIFLYAIKVNIYLLIKGEFILLHTYQVYKNANTVKTQSFFQYQTGLSQIASTLRPFYKMDFPHKFRIVRTPTILHSQNKTIASSGDLSVRTLLDILGSVSWFSYLYILNYFVRMVPRIARGLGAWLMWRVQRRLRQPRNPQ